MFWRVILVQTYRCTIQALFNLIFNAWHFTRIIIKGDLLAAYDMRYMILEAAQNGRPVDMTYGYDGITKGGGIFGMWPCWTASTAIFSYSKLTGNCMDGAHFMAWLLCGRVRVWIPDGKRWWRHIHYAAEVTGGRVWSLGPAGLEVYDTLEECRPGGRWI